MAIVETDAASKPRFQLVPLYLQVADVLRKRIASGQLSGQLLSEYELASELGVSSGTVRKALDSLEAEGVVVRRQGRGTFVRQHVAWEDLSPAAKSLLDVLGDPTPTEDPADRSIVAAETAVDPVRRLTADNLRVLAEGAGELAAWLDRRAQLAGA